MKLHYTLFLFVCAFFIFISFDSYKIDSKRDFYTSIENTENWLSIDDNVDLTVHEVTQIYKDKLGLGQYDKLILKKEHTDNLGNKHSRFQHYFKNIKVKGSEVYVHSKNEKVYLVNHNLVKYIDFQPRVNFSKEYAFEKAVSKVPSDKYMWESKWAEKLIKRIKKDPYATNYPTQNLVLFAPNFSKDARDYKLCYDITIHSMVPEKKIQMFIDASTGEIVQSINDIHSGKSKGTAETKYHSTRDIVTDSIAVDTFRLVDTLRGNGIETYNAERQTDMSLAVDFYDTDNYWTNINQFQDEVATDVHFGAESTFDYYLEKLGRLGLNDTMPFISFVHVDQSWNNATWNGMFARFGDGGGSNLPFTSLDVVAHEFTHGLTDFTADLVYMDESGALNESFSDIFGTAVEYFADSATFDWLIGEDFISSGSLRSMSNPKDLDDPSTYYGEYWVFGASDNGGVHSNSGVQNYWYYLLSVGGEGINDNGDTFNIDSLGIDAASQISYNNLSNYLMETSQYFDARLGAMQSAIDIYGDCSHELKQTANAWHAVGVGQIFPRYDIEIVSIIGPDSLTCGLSPSEELSILLTFSDCENTISPGTKIPLHYTVNGTNIRYDTFLVTETLMPYDTFNFTFSEPLTELSDVGLHEVLVSSDFPDDNRRYNDFVISIFERIYDQNTDVKLEDIISPLSSCFMQDEPFEFAIKFKGCDSIPAGELMTFSYSINESQYVNIDFNLDSTLHRDDVLRIPLSETYDFSDKEEYNLNAKLIYLEDTLELNNEINDILIDNPKHLEFNVELTMEGLGNSSLDSFYTFQGNQTNVSIEDGTGYDETKGLTITGYNGLDDLFLGKIEKPTSETIWDNTSDYYTKNCFCADLTNYNKARLIFRIQVYNSPMYQDLFNINLETSSAARLLLNGEEYGNTFEAQNFGTGLYFNKNYDISDYSGAPLEICFETFTLTSKDFDPYLVGDNVNLDNILLIADFVQNVEDVMDDEVLIYPIPASDEIIVESDNINFINYNFEIIGVMGEKYNSNLSSVSSDRTIIGVSELNSGIYFLKIFNESNSIVKKIIVR